VTEQMAFIDLASQQARLRTQIDSRIARVLDHGQYVMGPEVLELERELSVRTGAEAITCASGTDALVLTLMALGVSQGDTVLVPGFTFAATAEAVVLAGGSPAFVDVDERTFLVTPTSVARALAALKATGRPRPVGIITVDLFGHPVDADSIAAASPDFDGWVVADSAQSFGASIGDRQVGSFGTATCTSFFPSKPLGAYGDGGAVFTRDPELAESIRSLRVHGQDNGRFTRIGMTGRLDTIQAAVLLAKLTVFDDELDRRTEVADRYSNVLASSSVTPSTAPGHRSAWAQYTIKVANRDRVAEELATRKIPTAVHYRVPLPDQPAYSAYADLHTPSCRRLAGEVLSLPMHPYLTNADQERVAAALAAATDQQ